MKLTYRDKVMLITVLVILVWVIGIFLIIKPAYSTMSTTQSNLSTKETELTTLKNQATEEENLPQTIKKDYDAAVESANYFYPFEDKEVATNKIRALMTTSKRDIEHTTFTIDDYASKSITAYSFSKAEVDDSLTPYVDQVTNASVATTDTTSTNATATPVSTAAISAIGCYTITTDFKCSFTELTDFIDDLQTTDQKSLIIDSCEITDITADTIEGNLSFTYYMAPTLVNPLDVNSADDAAAVEDATTVK